MVCFRAVVPAADGSDPCGFYSWRPPLEPGIAWEIKGGGQGKAALPLKHWLQLVSNGR